MKRLILTLTATACLTFPALATAANPALLRINATCNAYANMSRIASPDVVYEMCLNGAKESMQGRDSVCESKIRQFSEQADTLDGMGRAEYIEIAQAYRMGCNAGKQPSKINDESKSARAKTLSPEEIKERQEIHSYGEEIRKVFGQMRADAPALKGQRCSVNIWFSQNGNVLSTKVESGDDDACSYILRRTKGMKLSPMNDSQYKAFRNTPIDFGF